MRRIMMVAALAASGVLVPAAGAAAAGVPQPGPASVSRSVPRTPCTVTATQRIAAGRLQYGGALRCRGAVRSGTLDVVPELATSPTTGGVTWAPIAGAGLYQGPVGAGRLRLSSDRPATAAASYRVLVVARIATGHGSEAMRTVCAGCSGSVPTLGLRMTRTRLAGASNSVTMRQAGCTALQRGLRLGLVNGTWVATYGGGISCSSSAGILHRSVEVCMQRRGRVHGHAVWRNIAGSCLGTRQLGGSTVSLSSGRSVAAKGVYRITATATVVRRVGARVVTARATLRSGAGAP